MKKLVFLIFSLQILGNAFANPGMSNPAKEWTVMVIAEMVAVNNRSVSITPIVSTFVGTKTACMAEGIRLAMQFTKLHSELRENTPKSTFSTKQPETAIVGIVQSCEAK